MNFIYLNRAVQEYLKVFECILKNMICNMDSVELNESISYNFIVQMIPHHKAAIEMSENILKYTDNAKLREIATSIISEQTKSISDMRQICDECCCLKNSCRSLKNFQDKIEGIKRTMFAGMSSAYSDNCIDLDFIREMLPHHIGAVKMSKTTLEFDICEQLRPILGAIITSQEKGINQMKILCREIKCNNSR